MGTKERNALARFEAAVREHAWRGSKHPDDKPEIDKAYVKAKKEMEALIARVDRVIAGPDQKPDLITPVVQAAQRVCASITETDIDAMAVTLPSKDRTEFAAAMTDLGQAVQDYEG